MTKHFDYTANSTRGVQRHQVWFDDEETLLAKYKAAAGHGARGVAMWTANMGDDAMWDALRQFKEM